MMGNLITNFYLQKAMFIKYIAHQQQKDFDENDLEKLKNGVNRWDITMPAEAKKIGEKILFLNYQKRKIAPSKKNA